MTPRDGGRALAYTASVGAAWGWMAGTALMTTWGSGQFIGALVIGLVFGGPIGAFVGLLIGMPIVVVIDWLRHRVKAWRPLGTALAAAFAPWVSFVLLDDPAASWSALLVPASLMIVVGASAWIGLGWIFAAPRDVIPDVAHAPHSV
jgi:hypothetical protein